MISLRRKIDPLKMAEETVTALVKELADDLHACLLYGSAVRGDFIPGKSDINLLIVPRESSAELHGRMRPILRKYRLVDPFIVGLPELERSMGVFGLKFGGIKRDYKVLAGADPLADWEISPDLNRFLCEQSLRNLRLRMVHAYMRFGSDWRSYEEFLIRALPALMVDLSEVARLLGHEVPHDYPDQLALFEKVFEIDTRILGEMLGFKQKRRALTAGHIHRIHEELHALILTVLRKLESSWKLPEFSA